MPGIKRDHYEVLGVPPAASAGEIHRAFRSLARELHPDVNPGHDAAAQFDELSSAYAVLRDPGERARYDRLRLGQAPSLTSRQPRRDVSRLGDEKVTVNVSLVIRLRNPFRWPR